VQVDAARKDGVGDGGVDVADVPRRADDDVAHEGVAHLVSVLGVDAVAARVPEDVVLDERVVRLVHGDAALVRVLDGVAAEDAVGAAEEVVPVQAVAADAVALAALLHARVLHLHRAAARHDGVEPHVLRVALGAEVVAGDDHRALQVGHLRGHPHLKALYRLHPARSLVGERRADAHRPAREGGDGVGGGSVVSSARVLAGRRRDTDPVARPPAHRRRVVVEENRLRACLRGGREQAPRARQLAAVHLDGRRGQRRVLGEGAVPAKDALAVVRVLGAVPPDVHGRLPLHRRVRRPDLDAAALLRHDEAGGEAEAVLGRVPAQGPLDGERAHVQARVEQVRRPRRDGAVVAGGAAHARLEPPTRAAGRAALHRARLGWRRLGKHVERPVRRGPAAAARPQPEWLRRRRRADTSRGARGAHGAHSAPHLLPVCSGGGGAAELGFAGEEERRVVACGRAPRRRVQRRVGEVEPRPLAGDGRPRFQSGGQTVGQRDAAGAGEACILRRLDPAAAQDGSVGA